jgi:phage-related tail fiber protein
MSTLQVRITDLATRVATEIKSVRTLVNGNASDLSALTTTQKTSLVSAINELKTAIDNAPGSSITISDSTSSTTEVWSSSKIAAEIQAAKDALTNGAAAALDTLSELASALGNDANFSSTIITSLSYRLRFDAAQTLTSDQKTQACANLGIGEPDTDFVTTFNSGLV